MARVFSYNPILGSLKEKVSGLFPQNTNNVAITLTEKGRASSFDANNYLLYNISNFRSTDNEGTIAIMFRDRRLPSDGNAALWGTNNSAGFNDLLYVWVNTAGWLRLSVVKGGLNIGLPRIVPSPLLIDKQWHLGVISTNGSRYQMLVDNVDYAISGDNSGAWFNDLNPTNRVSIGAIVAASALNRSRFDIGFIYIYDEELDATGRNRLWQEFIDSRQLLQNIVLNRDDPQNQMLHITGDNWDATGQEFSHSIGNGDFEIDSTRPPFKCFQDATGKYIESTGSGNLRVRGIDLSLFPDSGYIKKVGGDLNVYEGQTVNAASPFSFGGNVLSIRMSAGQKLRPPLTIVKDATV